MKKILFILFVGLSSGWVCAQEPVTVKSLGVSTFGSQVIGINNYAPAGSPGGNVWIGNGGQSSTWTTNVQGSQNVGIGTGALLNVGTGFSNLAVGLDALKSNTSGSLNVALGAAALFDNTTGSDNMAIGALALGNANGNQNTAIGYASLASIIGVSNVGIGYGAQYARTSGNHDVAIGWMAGRYQTSTYGTEVTSSNESVYIGSQSYSGGNNRNNQIVIGFRATGNGSNTTTIGNSNTTHTVFQYGKTLVGYSAAQDRGSYALQVNGQIYATNAAIATSDARLKERIAPLSSGLKEVMALRPCTFDFKQGTEQNLATGRQVGFIAQEVASVLQGREWALSVVQEAGGNLGIAETKLLPLLVKAVQEQQAQIEKLSAQLSLLQQQIGEMGAKAEATKSSVKKVALK